jgi:hypothetical protein
VGVLAYVAWRVRGSRPHRPSRGAAMADPLVQRNQPPGVPPLRLDGERTLPDVPAENY